MKSKKELKIKIELAGKRHKDGIKKVKTITWLATYPNKEYGITKKDILDFWASLKKSGKKKKYKKSVKKWAALAGQRVVGHCMVDRNEKYNEVKAIYILPEYQKVGIGGRLFRKGMDYLGQEKEIRLYVVSYNKNAIDFYNRYGFRQDKRFKNNRFDLLNGKYMPEIVLVKRFK